jgi:hypothetical protein
MATVNIHLTVNTNGEEVDTRLALDTAPKRPDEKQVVVEHRRNNDDVPSSWWDSLAFAHANA